jgi:hypothetical protein
MTVFRPKREKVTGDWRKFRNEDLHNFFSSPCINNREIKSRSVRWTVDVAHMRNMRNARTIYTGEPKGILVCRWEDTVKVCLETSLQVSLTLQCRPIINTWNYVNVAVKIHPRASSYTLLTITKEEPLFVKPVILSYLVHIWHT